jgi:biopolymer transport protein ExbD
MRDDLEEAQINLTPLIDVVFVILIMFIVIAPLLEIDRVTLAEGPPLRNETIKQADEISPITIHVLQDNSIIFNHKPTTLKELAIQLQAARRAQPTAHPQLFQDKNASFGTYQAVKNVVAGAGFEDLDVILKPDV